MRLSSVMLALAGALLLAGVAGAGGSSDARFAPPKLYESGQVPLSVTIADLDGDGKPDLASTDSGSATISVFIATGKGAFEANQDFDTPKDPEAIAAGDLNGDGHIDLVTANYDAGNFSVLINRGDGSFRVRHDYVAG